MATAAAAAAARAPATTPAPTLAAIWQLAPAPASLEASVIASTTELIASRPQYLVHYTVDCPRADTAENNACRQMSIYPAEVYYSQGSIRGGTYTDRAASRTTAWRCALGTCQSSDAGCQGPVFARCNQTITAGASGGGAVTTTTTSVAGCEAGQRSAVLHITAGAEKIGPPAYWLPTGMGTDVAVFASNYASAWNEELEKAGCPRRTTLAAPGQTSGAAGPGSGGSTTTPPPTGSGPAQQTGGGAAVPTKSGASRRTLSGVGVRVVGVVWAVTGVVGMVLSS